MIVNMIQESCKNLNPNKPFDQKLDISRYYTLLIKPRDHIFVKRYGFLLVLKVLVKM